MKFKEITKRITGFSTPIFGLSWNPPESERAVAKRVIVYLEDRRVLYNFSQREGLNHCVKSVIEIRHILTQELSALDKKSALANSLQAMRAACRKFLDSIPIDERIARLEPQRGYFPGGEFYGALGELRGVFGVHLAQIAGQHGLDIEDELASILPVEDESDEK